MSVFQKVKHTEQNGSAMVECCIVMLPIMMLASLALEVTYWHITRQKLTLAFSQAIDLATMHNGSESVVVSALQHRLPELNIQASDVRTIGDTKTWFAMFADRQLSQRYGQPAIRHDFLISQHQRLSARGGFSTEGIRQQNILHANTLSMTVTAWHKPYLSWLGTAMKAWHGHNRIAIRVSQSALMQSHRFKPQPHVLTETLISKTQSLLIKKIEAWPSNVTAKKPASRSDAPKAWQDQTNLMTTCEDSTCCTLDITDKE